MAADGSLEATALAGTYQQLWADLTTGQDERGSVNCLAVSQTGDAVDMPGRRARVKVLVAAAEDAAAAAVVAHLTFDGTTTAGTSTGSQRPARPSCAPTASPTPPRGADHALAADPPGPSWTVSDVFNGWSEALTGLGETVEEYPLDAALRFFNNALAETGKVLPCGCREMRKYLDREQAARLAIDPILAAANRFWPDVILCTSAFFMQPWLLEILRARRHKIVLLATEAPYQDDYQLKVAQYADLTLLNDPVEHRRVPGHRPRRVHAARLPGAHPLPAAVRRRTGIRLRVRRHRVPLPRPVLRRRWTWPG